jgi:hypothetical protein
MAWPMRFFVVASNMIIIYNVKELTFFSLATSGVTWLTLSDLNDSEVS